MLTSPGYEILTKAPRVSNPQRVATLYGATRSDSAWGVDVDWATADTLHVRFHGARNVVQFDPLKLGLQGMQFTSCLRAAPPTREHPRAA